MKDILITPFDEDMEEQYQQFFRDYENAPETRFIIKDDSTADWAVRKIKESDAEHDRLIALALEKITDLRIYVDQLKLKKEKDNWFLKSALNEYMNKVNTKETKTQKTYKLLSGTLTFKKPSYELVRDDGKLMEFAKDYVDMVPKFRWGDFKKTLTVVGSDVVDENGEVVPGIEVVETEGSFTIK